MGKQQAIKPSLTAFPFLGHSQMSEDEAQSVKRVEPTSEKYWRGDYHVHSTFSIDGRSSIGDMCQSALLLGLDEVGFSEHMDFEQEDPGRSNLDYEGYSSAIDVARETFGDRLTIRKGVEVDYQSRHVKAIEQWLKGRMFDFRIGSVHFVTGKPIDLGGITQEALKSLYPAYCKEIILSVKSGLFDVVGHFD